MLYKRNSIQKCSAVFILLIRFLLPFVDLLGALFETQQIPVLPVHVVCMLVGFARIEHIFTAGDPAFDNLSFPFAAIASGYQVR